ncbi:MAG: hypothetical protein M3680_35025, partial [Myxococcota bacterium]|nr:hypothetical protein [Myxococcota bacterium]
LAVPAVALDAAIVPAVVPPDAAPQLADSRLVIVNDTWCEVTIDGVARGKIVQRKELVVTAGRHAVICEQPNIAGHRWVREVEVAPGASLTVQGSMLALVDVTIAIGDVTIDGIGYSRGVRARLKPGRYQASVGGRSGWLDIPRVARCQVREDAGRLVCDP